MDKNAIKRFAVWARRELIERVAQRAARFGIEENKPMDEKANAVGSYVFSDAELEQRRMLILRIRRDGYKQVMEEAAYTWFNRFIALRFMEVNGYLPSYVRVFSNESGAFDPQMLAEALHVDLYGLDMEKVYALEENDRKEELFKYLLITQCNDMARMLPGLFETIADYTELLFPDNLLRAGSVIEQMVTAIPEDDWKDAVQIIGWLYQYYNTEPKDEVFAGLKKNIKISKEKIPAATQLFTPDWIVRYMVENSLGRLWVEGHPDDAMKAGWKYYLEEAPQAPEVEAQLKAIRAQYAQLDPSQILCCDCCMGSGHILVYMFDVLMQIYLSYGYTTNEAVESIVRNNLWGMDIDDRAAQLAYFAVMMKAQQYDGRWLAKQLKRSVQPNVFALQDSPEISERLLSLLEDQRDVAERVLDAFRDAKEYGSIIQPNVTVEELNALSERLDAVLRDSEAERADAQADAKALFDALGPQIRQCRALVQKYHVVTTNPPYMGSSGMGENLARLVKSAYPDSKSDLFAVFIECIREMLAANGYQAMITQHAWMFLSSFERLRMKLQQTDTVNMAHLGARAFEEIGGEVVQTTSFVLQKCHINGYRGTYCRLIEPTTQQGKADMFLAGENRYVAQQDSFAKIPGAPVVYTLSDRFFSTITSPTVSDLSDSRCGMNTGDNEGFIRFWFEINALMFNSSAKSTKGFHESGCRYAVYNKGGNYRKWYGNLEYVIKFNQTDYTILLNQGNHLPSRQFYFRDCITWTDMSTHGVAFRYQPHGSVFDGCAATAFPDEHSDIFYLLGLLNSTYVATLAPLVNPTLHFKLNDYAKIPYRRCDEKQVDINKIVENCILLSRSDWDSFETSWNFQTHPLIRCASFSIEEMREDRKHNIIDINFIRDAFERWDSECYVRYITLKSNEEELNRIFIDIYGLQDELTPEVADKDVTVRRADLGRDIRSLISYAVGCMFGRYSIDVPGLILAGQKLEERFVHDPSGASEAIPTTLAGDYIYKAEGSKEVMVCHFMPDRDAILSITDDEYFDDDIAARFVEWVRTVYGAESLEANLKYIADALGVKGTPRDVIRQYFINDFYKDHLKVYQKRPIYWLFDSGKKNGFKCLIYMHRYQPDTLARIRTDYLHELQARYRNAIETLERQIATATTAERVKLQKRLTALKAQAEEARVYEEKIHHLADQMIKIDLDDGVKHNYNIFKDVLAPIK